MKPFSFSQATLDTSALRAALEDPTAGGYTSFEGWVRNHNEGHAVTRLEYEAFEALAVKEGERIVTEAIEKFGVVKAACVHRVGSLAIGDMAVWVGVSSRHRAEAFAACRYIIDEVKHRVPIWKKEHYVTGDSGWVNCERCAVHGLEHAHAHEHEHEHEHEQHMGAGRWALGAGQSRVDRHHDHSHDHDHVRANGSAGSTLASAQRPEPSALPDYSRQIALRDVGEAGQRKLRDARVLVIGAGGLGVPVLTYLAGAGVGTLGIVDGDTLDASNLHRQTLYSLADVGKPKVQLAAERLRALNPEVNVRTHQERFNATNASLLLTDYDLVVECSDNFATKFLANDAAVAARKPAVLASVYQYEGQLQVYRAQQDSACLRCLWPEATRDGLVGNCAEAGVLGPVPGVFGSLQALETLKLLLGLPGLANEIVIVDLLTFDQHKFRTQRRAECDHDRRGVSAPNHQHLEVMFAQLSPAVSAGYTLIDIRDDQEVRALPIADAASTHIPLASLLASTEPLKRDERYLLVCTRGTRSRAAAEHLRERGFTQAFSLKGGLAALARTD